MHTEKELLKALKTYIDKNGPFEAMGQLARRGVGSRTAQSLVTGTYKASPSSMLRLVLTEMLKDELKVS